MKKKVIVLIIIIFVIIAAIMLINMKQKDIEKINNNKIIYENNNFNLNLIKKVNLDNHENYLISPYSIEIALNMLKEGAEGNTLKELENVIGSRNINDITIKDHVSVANASFIKNEYKKYVKKEYYEILKDKYNSEILYDDFKTPKVINDWVNEKTNGMIEDILDNMNDYFVLGIANALAIDVEWDSPFDCSKTISQKFTKEDGSSFNTEMMHASFKHEGTKYLKNDNATGIIIPYKKYNSKNGKEDMENGNNLEFIAILPNDSVSNYINNLTSEELDNLLLSAEESSDKLTINLSLPRFKYDYKLDNFMDILKNMGIKEIFDSEKADLTNIIERNETTDNIFVGEVIHKTHIDLNEKGTKAAAVTYAGIFSNGAMLEEKRKVNIIFNKPFIYMIRDNETKEILFFGTIYEPNKWNGSTCSN